MAGKAGMVRPTLSVQAFGFASIPAETRVGWGYAVL